MNGNKLLQVKDSLDFLLGQLNEGDRVSLIQFDSKAEILTNLNPMTFENIKKYKKIIKDLKTRDSTDLRKAIGASMMQIVKRKT